MTNNCNRFVFLLNLQHGYLFIYKLKGGFCAFVFQRQGTSTSVNAINKENVIGWRF